MDFDSLLNKGINYVKSRFQADSNHTASDGESGADGASYPNAVEVLEQFFAQYNCKFQIDADDEDKSRGFDRYYFDFQGGHFVAYANRNGGVEVLYPRILDIPARYIDIVRSVCNTCNFTEYRFKYSYENMEKDGEVTVHISYYADVMTVQLLAESLAACFQAQRSYNDRLKNALEDARDEGTLDVERTFSDRKRELFLIRNQELRHGQLPPANLEFDHDKSFNLGYLLECMLGRSDIELSRLQVVNDGGLTKYDAADCVLEDVNLAAFIVNEKADSPSFCSSVATAVATYHTPMSENANANYALTITMREAGVTDHSAFFRVVVALDHGDANMRNSIAATAGDKTPLAITFLMGYDYASAEQMRAEAEYMWKDALIKVKEEKTDELTEEQQLLLNVTDTDIAYNMYWGRRYMLSNRYFEAIAHFENVYRSTRHRFFSVSKEATKQLLQAVYCLGFCYCELCLFEKAFYYLNMVKSTGDIHHAMEYVNVLANSGDLRVFKEIETIVDDVRQQFPDDDDLPEHVQKLLSFLKRRHGYSLIEFGKLDEAEKVFKSLLDDPTSQDYAVSELAYIQKLKANESPESSES